MDNRGKDRYRCIIDVLFILRRTDEGCIGRRAVIMRSHIEWK